MQVRSIQMDYNNVVSEASRVTDLHDGDSNVTITVKPMAQVSLRINSGEHAGPILFVLDF